MPKLTKKIVDALERDADRDVFVWDSEVRGFGVRLKPSGTKTFIIQYRNTERRTRRFVIGQCGVLTAEVARDLAKKKLASVIDGGDPSQERHAAREGMTVAEVCDWYLEEADAGRLLGRNRRPIKASSVAGDRSRIEQHIKPLVGIRVVSHLKLADIERLQADIAAGKSARERHAGRGGQTSGGAGVAGRAISTLRSLLNHARRLGIIEQSPANGVRVIASNKLKRRLSAGEVRHFGKIMAQMEREGEHPDAGDLAIGGAIHPPVGRLQHMPLATLLLRRQSAIVGDGAPLQGTQQAVDRLGPVVTVRVKRHKRCERNSGRYTGESDDPDRLAAGLEQEMRAVLVRARGWFAQLGIEIAGRRQNDRHLCEQHGAGVRLRGPEHGTLSSIQRRRDEKTANPTCDAVRVSWRGCRPGCSPFDIRDCA